MPNTASAKKELRKSRSRRLRNRAQRSTLRNAVKRVRAAIAAQDRDGAEQSFRVATKKLDQAAAKNLIHRNLAARVKSRLSKAIKMRFAATT
ncbi:MAG: 30S ribosomal protein S20 [Planctomycetaceae bacterium]|nr:30S ribosomal protein S20 [Planctomycetaceae bacterium]